MSDTYFLIFGIVVSLIGLALIVLHIRTVSSCGERIIAQINNLKVQRTVIRGSSVYSYCPEFIYTVNGKTYQGTADFSTYRKNKYQVGDPLEIYYNYNDPEQYRVKGRCTMLIWGVIILAIGLPFVILYFF